MNAILLIGFIFKIHLDKGNVEQLAADEVPLCDKAGDDLCGVVRELGTRVAIVVQALIFRVLTVAHVVSALEVGRGRQKENRAVIRG